MNKFNLILNIFILTIFLVKKKSKIMFIVFFEKIQFNKTLRYDDYENINIYYPLSVSIRTKLPNE